MSSLISRIVSAWALVSSILTLILLTSAAAPGPKTLDAEKLVLRDAKGKIRMLLGASGDEEPSLKLMDKDGQIRTHLSQTTNGAVVFTLNDQSGESRIGLDLDQNDRTSLTLEDQEKRFQICLFVKADGRTDFGFGSSKTGGPLISMRAGIGLGSDLSFFDENGSLRYMTGVNLEGSPYSHSMHRSLPRLSLSLHAEGFPIIDLGGEKNKPRISIFANTDSSNLMCLDKDGKPRLSAFFVNDDRLASLSLYALETNPRLDLMVAGIGLSTLTFRDGQKNDRMVIGLHPKGMPYLRFNDVNSSRKLFLFDDQPTPIIRFFNDKLEHFFELPRPKRTQIEPKSAFHDTTENSNRVEIVRGTF